MHPLLKLVKLTWNVLTFFLALAEALDSDPEFPAPLFADDDTWSAGKDSGTGCNVGVLMVLEAAAADEVVVVKTDVGPEDMTRHSCAKYTLVKFWDFNQSLFCWLSSVKNLNSHFDVDDFDHSEQHSALCVCKKYIIIWYELYIIHTFSSSRD